MGGIPYRTIRKLAAGGMADVFEVESPDGRRFALKVFRREKDSSFLHDRFIAEVKILTTIYHPRIVRVHEYGIDETTGEPWFVMDLMTDADGTPSTLENARRHFAKMPDGLPVHRLGDFGGPRPVRVRERVALPGRRVAHERQLPLVQICVIAYLREARGAGEIPENQHDEVACRRELPRVHAVRVRGLFNEPAGYSLNNLPQSMIYSWRRLVVVCFHACRVYRKTGKATLLFKRPVVK